MSLHHSYSLINPEWYESFDRYVPGVEFIGVVRGVVPDNWRVAKKELWLHASPISYEFPDQGWKIHVSSVLSDAEAVLAATVRICVKFGVPFKALLDRHLLQLVNSKGWSREAGGKFITIYPGSQDQFMSVLEALDSATKDYRGPYILSDRRYKQSSVVHYRYGGISGQSIRLLSGEQYAVLTAPDGSHVADMRSPFWNPPSWVVDPVKGEEAPSEAGQGGLAGGRYNVTAALAFSMSGGVYLATDNATGDKVVIKEARPFTTVDAEGVDAKERLRREYEVLKLLSETQVAPRPIDMFDEWEHRFIVLEHVPGMHIGQFSIANGLLSNIIGDHSRRAEYRITLLELWLECVRALARIHATGVVVGDLSLTNVLVVEGTRRVRIIDFEAAWGPKLWKPSTIHTPGFKRTDGTSEPGLEDDYLAMGSILLGSLFPINNLLGLDMDLAKRFLRLYGREYGLSEGLLGCIASCFATAPSERTDLEALESAIFRELVALRPQREFPERAFRPRPLKLKPHIEQIREYILASADYQRSDRLVPADPMVFLTNPSNIAYGASGVAYSLYKLSGEVPSSFAAWIMSRNVSSDDVPGLYVGLSGQAWVLWEMGFKDPAMELYRKARAHPELRGCSSVMFGATGFGLTSLKLFANTKDQSFLDDAAGVADWLCGQQDSQGGSLTWTDYRGDMLGSGYAVGNSGVALFLLYAFLATGNKEYLRVGRQALKRDLDKLYELAPGYRSVPRGESDPPVLSPYWLDGSAGVVTTLLRYWAVTKEEALLECARELLRDCRRKYTIFPGLFQGLSGVGNVLLDAFQFTSDTEFLKDAKRAAEGVMSFAVKRHRGIAYPGEQLFRLSTDFATGSSGISLFLARLDSSTEGEETSNFNFLVDDLIDSAEYQVASQKAAD